MAALFQEPYSIISHKIIDTSLELIHVEISCQCVVPILVLLLSRYCTICYSDTRWDFIPFNYYIMDIYLSLKFFPQNSDCHFQYIYSLH